VKSVVKTLRKYSCITEGKKGKREWFPMQRDAKVQFKQCNTQV
jgi:hypothetical protein